jgi:thioredoxin:protein disulfide reductase
MFVNSHPTSYNTIVKNISYLCLLFAVVFFSLVASADNDSSDPFSYTWDGSTRQFQTDQALALDVYLMIPPGHYLYKDKTDLSLIKGDGLFVESVEHSPPVTRMDPFSGKEKEILEGTAFVRALVKATDKARTGTQLIELELRYQGCSQQLCYRQQKKIVRTKIDIIAKGRQLSTETNHHRSLSDRLKEALEEGGALVFFLVFLGGLLTDFTPCVLPLIPLTLAVIGIRRETSHRKNFVLSLVLVLTMATVYAVLGLLVAALGLQLGFLFKSPIFLLVAAALFVFFALGLFDVYQLQAPMGMRNWMAKLGGQGYWGAAIAGATIGVLAAPCVGPVIASLLVWVARRGDLAEGFFLLFSFGMGMGSLLLVAGTFYGTFAGRIHGGVLSDVIKKIMGILLILPALYYGMLAYDNLFGSGEPYANSGYWLGNPDTAYAQAADQHKPLIIDFYADWCIPCIEWDKTTFSDEKVKQHIIENFVPLKLDCTDNSKTCDELFDRYEVIGSPTILLTDQQGKSFDEFRIIGDPVSPDQFLDHLVQFRKHYLKTIGRTGE